MIGLIPTMPLLLSLPQAKWCPKDSSFLSAYMHERRGNFLGQARCDDMLDAAKPFAGGLTWCRIPENQPKDQPKNQYHDHRSDGNACM
jgi:hypothetical protein